RIRTAGGGLRQGHQHYGREHRQVLFAAGRGVQDHRGHAGLRDGGRLSTHAEPVGSRLRRGRKTRVEREFEGLAVSVSGRMPTGVHYTAVSTRPGVTAKSENRTSSPARCGERHMTPPWHGRSFGKT